MFVDGEEVRAVTQTRSYRVITPLFGGGPIPGQADEDLPVRGSSIRGQLRFWWRATQGGRFDGDLHGMREAECSLWGAASTPKKPRPSMADVVVKVKDRGRQIDWSGLPRHIRDIRRYAMLGQRLPVLDGIEFELSLTYPETKQEEIEAALWAWETFGGIGGRTRRGFGALSLTAIDGKPVPLPKMNEIHSIILEGLRKHVTKGVWPKGVPHLSHGIKMVLCEHFPDPQTAWDHMIGHLMSFRQSRFSRRGGSRWPEPDAIRRLTGQGSRRFVQTDSEISKFPRAAFGLPIVFQFRDGRDQVTLEGIPKEERKAEGQAGLRLASPLVLRPLVCENGAVGLALILEGTGVRHLPKGLRLRTGRKEHKVDFELTLEEARQVEPLGGNPDVLEAFLEYIKKEEKVR